MWFVCVCVLHCGLASELLTCMRRQYFTELQGCWLTRTNSIYLMKNEGFSVRCECPKTTSLSTEAIWSSCQSGTNLWPFRQMRECEIIVSFTGVVKSTFCSICVRERELWPDFHASTNSCLVYSVLFVLKHIIFTSIVWPFIFRNFIWLNCRNSNCVTLCAMLQSIRCHFQVWTFTCPFNRRNKNSTKNFK